MRQPLMIAAMSVLTLAGCSYIPDIPWEKPPGADARGRGETAPQPAEVPPTPPAAEPTPVVPQAKPTLPEGEERPGSDGLKPEALVGLDQPRLVALIGAPASVRQEPPATIWRYTSDVCTADVYFYVDLNTQDLRVVTLSLRTDDDTPEAEAACLASIKSLAEETRD